MSRHVTQSEWNEFVARKSHAEFLQSWEWGENAYLQEGREILRISYPDIGAISAVCQLIERGEGTPFHYWYSPGGPISNSSEDSERIVEKITSELRLRRTPFIRCEPRYALPVRLGVKVKDERPSHTRILDLALGREELFASFHEKTRYNIRLAEKKGVNIRELFSVGEDHPDRKLFESAMKRFHALLSETAQRGEFSLHPWVHYTRLVHAFCRSSKDQPLEQEQPIIRLFSAWYGERMIAGILCMSYGDTMTYLHGASSYENRACMAPYALQWHAIQEGIVALHTSYDLWGVAPENAGQDHPWAGFTRFKQGFGGRLLSYPGTIDIVLSPVQYRLYSIARRTNRFFHRPVH